MPALTDLRVITFASLSLALLIGTTYSVLYSTYLDTSNPLLTHLPHPLHATDYFASKTNWLNTLFIKRAWGWTSAAFLLAFFTSPSKARSTGRFAKYATETAVWMLFAAWFFGPPLLERVIVASGGECVLVLPTEEGDKSIMNIPQQYCYTKSTVSPATHPELFTSFTSLPSEWVGAVPRLRRGHDISGHIFLLTMSVLFLADQLRASFHVPVRTWSAAHRYAVAANVALIGLWIFASYVTAVYFHDPFEKFSGFLLGLASFGITQTSIFKQLDSAYKAQIEGKPHQS